MLGLKRRPSPVLVSNERALALLGADRLLSGAHAVSSADCLRQRASDRSRSGDGDARRAHCYRRSHRRRWGRCHAGPAASGSSDHRLRGRRRFTGPRRHARFRRRAWSRASRDHRQRERRRRRGGATTFVTRPDTNPPVDDPAVVDFILRRARDDAKVRVHPAAALTKGLKGEEIAEIGLLAEAGAIAFCDGPRSVADARPCAAL